MKASILTAAFALAVAALPAHAQSGAAAGNGTDSTVNNGSKPATVQKAQDSVSNSAPGRATKRAARATKRGVKRGADGVTDTGNAIARKLPPAPAKQQ